MYLIITYSKIDISATVSSKKRKLNYVSQMISKEPSLKNEPSSEECVTENSLQYIRDQNIIYYMFIMMSIYNKIPIYFLLANYFLPI